MLDDVFIERVDARIRARRRQAEMRLRDEPQQEALPATVRAVALHDLRDVPVGLEGDPSAVAASFVCHHASLSNED
jgi:hypothetical protein